MPLPEQPPETHTALVSRQQFLRQGLGKVMGHVVDSLPKLPEPETVAVLRPPGAISPEAFIKTCEAFCTLCHDACPRQAIVPDAWGFPQILPETSPCVMCLDVPCTKVCPTEALTPLTNPQAIALGTAVIELTLCTAFQGSGCTQCHTSCPIPDTAIALTEGLPQILAEGCTGCGACVFDCPTPGAIYIRPHGMSKPEHATGTMHL